MNIIKRSEWGARRARRRSTVPAAQRQGFTAHYTTGQELGKSAAQVEDWVRSIQRHHMDSNGWADIGYNFLIDRDGRVFEGRGWDVIGAHAAGANTSTIGVAFLGNDDKGSRDITPAAQQAFHDLKRAADKRCGKTLTSYGHRDHNKTACPGDELYALARQGFPPSSTTPPASSTTPPASSTSSTSLELRRGSKGPRVGKLQQGLRSVFPLYARHLAVDNSYGPKTEQAVREFQRRSGLTVDGITGPRTRRELARYGINLG